jgi:hypothetical protein
LKSGRSLAAEGRSKNVDKNRPLKTLEEGEKGKGKKVVYEGILFDDVSLGVHVRILRREV